ncbi:MAG: HU family DNA-binding protein [Bacilli bacterium]|nr:HU family DNA-binding protein [Bacilli bacterium]
MSKADLVNFMSEETGLTKADSSRALEAMMNGIIKGLKEEGKVTLTGFCTFEKVFKEASTSRNPRTGEPVPVAAKNVPKIKAGSKLKEALN